VRPETINASRRDSDNARLLLAGEMMFLRALISVG
jgi:hypothetical protein